MSAGKEEFVILRNFRLVIAKRRPNEAMLTSSTPMTPAPITIISSGTFFRDSAPVEDTMLSSSI